MKMVLELADRTISKPTGVAENVFVKVDSESEEIEDFLNDDSIQFGVDDSPFNMDKDILFLEKMLFTINPRPYNPTNDNTNVESFSSFPNQENEPRQDEIDIFSIANDVLPPSNDDSDDEVDVDGNVIQNYKHEYSESEDNDLDNPLLPLPPPEPPD
nr:hypothetical protein [Tanacetum cinerariifolium]